VLVTSFNPLVVWCYQVCYVRFTAVEYNPNAFGNKFAHLTNNSVAKHYTGPEPSEEIEGNMWEDEELSNYIKELNQGEDLWSTKIKPMMKKIIVWSLECVQDNIPSRKRSCELFGYDFMIDDNFNPWLIEINSSPAMDYSSAITEKLVKTVCEDTIKVIVDYGLAPKKKKKSVDTGLFKQIHKAPKGTDKPIKAFGLNLICEGKKMNIKKLIS